MSAPSGGPNRPPAGLRRLLGRLLPREDREALGTLDDLWPRRVRRDGRLRALFWYLGETAAFALRLRGVGLVRRLGALPVGLLRDLRHGARVLVRHPGYTTAAVVTLGVGLGGVATVYNAANWVLLRPVPGVAAPEGLVTVRLEQKDVPSGSPAFPVSAPDLATLEAGIPALATLAGAAETEVHLEVPGSSAPRRVAAGLVSDGYFETLGLRPTLGSLASDEGAVVSHRLWREAWGASSAAPGSRVLVNGEPFPVAGVAPPGFRGPELPGGTDLWLPASALPRIRPGTPQDLLAQRGRPVFTLLVGRLAPSANPALVEAQGLEAMRRIREEYGAHSFYADYRFRAYRGVGLSPRVRTSVGRTLTLLGATAALLLFLAMANVTNLGLAHGDARSGSVAVHRALGASRGAVARRILVEHGLLGLVGAAVGVAVAVGAARLFRRASLSALGASLEGMALDARVLLFVTGTALTAAVLAGAVPALLVGGGDLLRGLKGRRHGDRFTSRLQGTLVVAQVALSAILLVGAGLLVRTVVNLRAQDPGFEVADAVRFSIDPRLHGYDREESLRTLAEVKAALAEEPGVLAIGFTSPELVRSSYLTALLRRIDHQEGDPEVRGAQFEVTPGFMEAAGFRLLAGRTPEEGDGSVEGPDAPVVVTRAAAEALFPGFLPDAVPGRRLHLFDREVTVVGVVEDVRMTGAVRESPAAVFRPWGTGLMAGTVTAWVRTEPATGLDEERIRARVRAVRPELPVFGLRSVRAQVDLLVSEQRVVALLALALALLGLVLAAVGLQGLLAYGVARRRREIGLRMALGAQEGSIVGGLLRRSLALTGAGALLGGGGAVFVTRYIEVRLFGVEPLDPLTYGAGAVVLLVLAALVTAAPARRATRIPPGEVLAAD